MTPADQLREARKILSRWQAAPLPTRSRDASRTLHRLVQVLLPADPARIHPLTGEPPTTDEVLDDPDAKAYFARVMTDVVPKIQGSAMTVSLTPRGETDIKFAVETGLSIMLDKPIIAMVEKGTVLPEHYRRVCDEIVEYEPGDVASGQKALLAAMRRIDPDGGDD